MATIISVDFQSKKVTSVHNVSTTRCGLCWSTDSENCGCNFNINDPFFTANNTPEVTSKYR